MKLTAKQTKALDILEDQETNELIFGGGAGGAKSMLGCYWLLKSGLRYPHTRWLMGRAKLKTLKETTLQTFFKVCQMQNLKEGDHYQYNSQAGMILLYNGSQILTKDLFYYPSDPNFDELGSLELTGAFIDECNQITIKAWNITKSRIRYMLDEYGLVPKILGTCNPAKNWVYSMFFLPHRDGKLQSNRKFIQSLLGDNPFISKHYKQNLLSLDKTSRERLLHGNWEYDDDPATLINQDSINDYFNAEHLKPTGLKYMTIDVARKGRDKTIFRIWHGWVCIARYELGKSLVNEVVAKAKQLQSKYGVANSNTLADEDGVGGGVVDYLKCKGFINNSRPLKGENYDNLKSQCSIKMAEKISNREAVEICEDQQVIQTTSEEMGQVKEKNIDKDGKRAIIAKDVMKEKLGRSPDDWDSIMMRYYFELNKGLSGMRAGAFG